MRADVDPVARRQRAELLDAHPAVRLAIDAPGAELRGEAARTDSMSARRKGLNRQNSARCARSRASGDRMSAQRATAGDLDVDCGRGRLAPSRICSSRSHQASFRSPSASDRDEERRRKAGGRKDAARLQRVVRVAIVERDRHVAARSIPFAKRDDIEAPPQNLAVLRETIR